MNNTVRIFQLNSSTFNRSVLVFDLYNQLNGFVCNMNVKWIFLCCFLQSALCRSTSDDLNKSQVGSCCRNFTACSAKIKYPDARRDESVIDDYHGTKVADPYRWLENPDSEETKQFIAAENEITQKFTRNCDEWQRINNKLTALFNYPKYGLPRRHGKYYYSSMNTGLQNQQVLYKQNSLEDEPTVFLDPNTLSADGTVALNTMAFSEDGTLVAYSLSESGSDWTKIRVRDVETGNDYSDLLERTKFPSISWTHDNKGFFYGRYPDQGGNADGSETDINENLKIYFHRVGESQEQDVLVAEFPENPSWLMDAEVSDCGKYLLLTIYEGLRDNLMYIADLEKNGDINGKIPLTPIISEFNADYEYITNTGSKMVFRTNKNAPNFRLIVIDVNNPAEQNWSNLIEEDPNDVLSWALCVNKNKIMVGYLHDVKDILQVHSLETGELIRTFPLEIGEIVSMSGHKKYSEFFFQLESFLTPGTIYRYDFTQPDIEPTMFREVKLNLEGFNKNAFDVRQVFYPSYDGTKIPMFIVQKKVQMNKGPKPCLLYGYGGFNYPIQPGFSENWLFFINSFDGVLAVANIRGGGEYGDKWHNEGRLLNKQNSYNDFQAAAEYLIQNKYTESKKLAIKGASNGGLLIGVCINQRPDLYGAAIAQVGVMDLLRYPKFTIGAAWASDYGNPDQQIYFENLRKFSPLHNIHSPNSTFNQYPSTLITTADHDDRVSPLHSLKFAATLQNAIRGNEFQQNPILLRVYSKAGHGSGKPTARVIEDDTDVLTFLYRALHINIEI